MKFKLAIGALLIMSSLCAFAGAKEDFVDAVVKSCGKSKDDAEKMATPGRAGNVIKWQMCQSGSLDIEGCSLPCSDASSKIGN